LTLQKGLLIKAGLVQSSQSDLVVAAWLGNAPESEEAKKNKKMRFAQEKEYKKQRAKSNRDKAQSAIESAPRNNTPENR
jgi:hypothetical protein